MFEKRIIPLLLIRDKRLVKTEKFKNETYIGDPINAARIFSDKEVDELIICDKSATRSGVNLDMLKEIVSECFIPITYAGGVKDINVMSQLYRIGIEKVCVDSFSLNDNLTLVTEAVKRFGASSVVAGLTIDKTFFGSYKLYNCASKKNESKDPKSYLLELQRAGVGEIFINYKNRDGVMRGYDIDHLSSLIQGIEIPCVVCGGAGNLDDMNQVLKTEGITGAAAGSVFVYSSNTKGIMINYPESSIKSIMIK